MSVLAECKSIVPGDEVRYCGEWLDVIDVRNVAPAGELRVLIVCDGEPGERPREFIAEPFALHRIRRAAPVKPKVSA